MLQDTAVADTLQVSETELMAMMVVVMLFIIGLMVFAIYKAVKERAEIDKDGR